MKKHITILLLGIACLTSCVSNNDHDPVIDRPVLNTTDFSDFTPWWATNTENSVSNNIQRK